MDNKKKMFLEEKEYEKIKSQTKVKEIEKTITELESQRNKIIKQKNRKIRTIIFYTLYSLVICLIQMIFISSFIDIFSLVTVSQKSLYIILIYIGAILISILGALTMAKTGALIRNRVNKKIVELSNKLKERMNEIKLEKERQELLDKEIDTILNDQKKQNFLLELKNQKAEEIPVQNISYIKDKQVQTVGKSKKVTRIKSKFK